MSNSDFANYWYLLKGSYDKGTHAVRHILESETEALEFVSNPGAMTVALGFDWNNPEGNDKDILNLILNSQYCEKALSTYLSSKYDIPNAPLVDLVQNDKVSGFINSEQLQIILYENNITELFKKLIENGMTISPFFVSSLDSEIKSAYLSSNVAGSTNYGKINYIDGKAGESPKTEKLLNFLSNISSSVKGHEDQFSSLYNLPVISSFCKNSETNSFIKLSFSLLKIADYNNDGSSGFIFVMTGGPGPWTGNTGTFYQFMHMKQTMDESGKLYISEDELNTQYENILPLLDTSTDDNRNHLQKLLLLNAKQITMDFYGKDITNVNEDQEFIQVKSKFLIPSFYEYFGGNTLDIIINDSYNAGLTSGANNLIIPDNSNTEQINFVKEGKDLNLINEIKRLMSNNYITSYAYSLSSVYASTASFGPSNLAFNKTPWLRSIGPKAKIAFDAYRYLYPSGSNTTEGRYCFVQRPGKTGDYYPCIPVNPKYILDEDHIRTAGLYTEYEQDILDDTILNEFYMTCICI